MAVADWRPNNIFYARVRALVNSDSLTLDGTPACQMECEFFVKLPQGTMAMIHLNNVVAQLWSYFGQANLDGMTAEVCRHEIFNVTYQCHP